MSMLLLYVGDNRYTIDNEYIVRVIPYVSLKQTPYELYYVDGILNLAGNPIPVIDFCQLIEKRPTRPAFHSRIILLKNPDKQEPHPLVGIIGERITDILDLKRSQFKQTDISVKYFPYLHETYSDQEGIIQYVDIPLFLNFLSNELFKNVATNL